MDPSFRRRWLAPSTDASPHTKTCPGRGLSPAHQERTLLAVPDFSWQPWQVTL